MADRMFTAVVTVYVDDKSRRKASMKKIEQVLIDQVILDLNDEGEDLGVTIDAVSIDWKTLKEHP